MSLTPPSSHGGGSSIGPVVVSGSASAGDIIIADSATTAHWGPESGGSNGLLSIGQAIGALTLNENAPLDAAHMGAGMVQGPPIVIAAGDPAAPIPGVAPVDVPDISDNIDCLATLYVTDITGTNTLTVSGSSSQATPVVGTGTPIDWTGTSATIVGVDLSWDPTSLGAVSAAGGVYFSTVLATCGPD